MVSLNEYRQLEFVNNASISKPIEKTHIKFIGNVTTLEDITRYKFFHMKLCSYQRKDLKHHY